MKKLRFTTLHIVMLGMIFYAIFAISVRIFAAEQPILISGFLVISSLVALMLYQQTHNELTGVEQIEILNHTTEVNLKKLLDEMPVGVIQFNPETNGIEWFNPYSELIFSKDNGEFDSQLVNKIIEYKKSGDASQIFEVGSNRYASQIDLATGMFYFFDANIGKRTIQDETSLRPVIGIISIDNYDDTTDNLADAETSQINTFIASFISEFSKRYNIFYRRVSPDRFYFFTDYGTLSQLMDKKFELLEEFRSQAKEKHLLLTLSMGISYGETDHNKIGQTALQNLNTALVRGGDQIVIREIGEHKRPIYFGGGSVSTVKRSRTRTRAMMTAISDRIKEADKVFVVGHRNLDMDALGASIGMVFFAHNIIDEAYIVYDQRQMGSDIKRAINRLEEENSTTLITVDRALNMVTPQSLLIMVDHAKLSLTLSTELYEKFTDVIVIDHHRRDDDFPNNAVLSFIESGASSASELVTELIQFQAARSKLTRLQASILMAGIMLDTKNFTTRVTSRTFDVASYLRTLGSDSVEIQTLSATEFSEYRLVNELILRANLITDGIIVTCGSNEKYYSKVITSKAADTMLSMAGIEASFVVTRTTETQISISARSRSKINVQRIMETLGGGGHFNLAACQFENENIESVERMLIQAILDDLKEEEE